MKLHARLRQARLNKELTQKQIADKLGIGTSMLCQYELGTTGMMKPKVRKYCEIVGV